MDITVIHPIDKSTVEVSVPGDRPAGRIVERLVELMEIPATGTDGRPLPWRFHHLENERDIGDSVSLDRAGVVDGDTLRVVPNWGCG